MKWNRIGIFVIGSIWIMPMATIAQSKLDSLLPVRGFCIDAPRPEGLDSFIPALCRSGAGTA